MFGTTQTWGSHWQEHTSDVRHMIKTGCWRRTSGRTRFRGRAGLRHQFWQPQGLAHHNSSRHLINDILKTEQQSTRASPHRKWRHACREWTISSSQWLQRAATCQDSYYGSDVSWVCDASFAQLLWTSDVTYLIDSLRHSNKQNYSCIFKALLSREFLVKEKWKIGEH